VSDSGASVLSMNIAESRDPSLQGTKNGPAGGPARSLRLDARDTVAIALSELRAGDSLTVDDAEYTLVTSVAAKHKFALRDFAVGDAVTMYGVVVGRATAPIRRGEAITVMNLRHAAAPYELRHAVRAWRPPDVSRWAARTFAGYRRSDGQVGTRNYWLVVPLVFCENRNVAVLKQAFEEELGFAAPPAYRQQVAELARLYREGKKEELRNYRFTAKAAQPKSAMFPHVDGIKFLLHEGGCGGTREDTTNLCALLAGYIHHPNVAGATVLSLGCQHAQVDILRAEIEKRDAKFAKPLLVFEQQKSGSEAAMLTAATRETFLELAKANEAQREPAPLGKLCVGLKCGGSDGFSGLSANPAVGHASDLLVTLGATTILSEFPELHGVEQNLIDRGANEGVAQKFIDLMSDYAARAKAVRAAFDMNPSPGNIKDGLITDAMKSAGAAKKGGTSPVTAVLDYPEYATTPGLNLQCTPGNDVECVTAQVGAGANVVLFTTGLGTPTGNPVAPVVKIATNSELPQRMPDIIDVDTGGVVRGEMTIEQAGELVLEQALKIASGELRTKAELLRQDDFIPWKRGVSL
jgi:altronate hydrolase